MDQSAALKWIQRNIAAFGGDPAKVIITGQSAGAGSVAQQIFSPRSKGLFRGGVMFSGCNYTGSNTPLAEAEATGLEIQSRLEAANLDEMRQVPADRILAIQNEFQVGRTVAGIRVGGVIDGYFMPDTKAAILAARGAADVPIIASFTHDEAGSPLKAAKTVAEYNAAAKELFGEATTEFLSLYPVTTDADIAQTRAGGRQRRRRPLQRAHVRNPAGPVPQVAHLRDGLRAQAPVRARREDRRPGHGHDRRVSHV